MNRKWWAHLASLRIENWPTYRGMVISLGGSWIAGKPCGPLMPTNPPADGYTSEQHGCRRSSGNSPLPLTTDAAAIRTLSGEDQPQQVMPSTRRRQHIRRAATDTAHRLRLSLRLTAIFFAPQIWFRPRAAARYTAAVVKSTGNVRPLDGVAAALKTRRADTVGFHHSCKRARTNKKQSSCRISD